MSGPRASPSRMVVPSPQAPQDPLLLLAKILVGVSYKRSGEGGAQTTTVMVESSGGSQPLCGRRSPQPLRGLHRPNGRVRYRRELGSQAQGRMKANDKLCVKSKDSPRGKGTGGKGPPFLRGLHSPPPVFAGAGRCGPSQGRVAREPLKVSNGRRGGACRCKDTLRSPAQHGCMSNWNSSRQHCADITWC